LRKGRGRERELSNLDANVQNQGGEYFVILLIFSVNIPKKKFSNENTPQTTFSKYSEGMVKRAITLPPINAAELNNLSTILLA